MLAREEAERDPKKSIGGTKMAKADWTKREGSKRPRNPSFRYKKRLVDGKKMLSVRKEEGKVHDRDGV